MNENMSAYASTLCSFVYRLMCFLPLLLVLCAEGNGEYPMLDKARRITGYYPHREKWDDTPKWESLAEENIRYSGPVRCEPGIWFRLAPGLPDVVRTQEDMNRFVYAMAYHLAEREPLNLSVAVTPTQAREWLRRINMSIYGVASLDEREEGLYLHMVYTPEARILAAFRNDDVVLRLKKKERAVLDVCVWWICENISLGMPNAQKLQKVHDSLVDTTVFVRKQHDPLMALLKGQGSSVAYSRAFQLLLHMLKLDCRMVYGTTEMNHVWNMVELDEEWFHLDVTWDDPIASTPLRTYNYYLLTDVEMDADHDWANPELYRETPQVNYRHFHMRNHTRFACRAAADGYTLPREDESLLFSMYDTCLNSLGMRSDAAANMIGIDLNRNPDIEAFFKLDKERFATAKADAKIHSQPVEKLKEAKKLLHRAPVKPRVMSQSDKQGEIRDSATFNQVLKEYAAELAGPRIVLQCGEDVPGWRMRQMVGFSDINKYAECYNAIYDEVGHTVSFDIKYWDHIRILHAARSKTAAKRLVGEEKLMLICAQKKASKLSRLSSDAEKAACANGCCAKNLKCLPVRRPMLQGGLPEPLIMIRSFNSLGFAQVAYTALNILNVPTELVFGRVKHREEVWCISRVSDTEWYHSDYYAKPVGYLLQPCCFKYDKFYRLLTDSELRETHTWAPDDVPATPTAIEKKVREQLKKELRKDVPERLMKFILPDE